MNGQPTLVQSTGGLRSCSSIPRDRTAGPQHHIRCPRSQVPEHPMKSKGAGAAAGCTGGGKNPPKSLSPFHPPVLPFHSNYRGLGGFHTQSPGPPFSEQLNLFNDSGGPGAPLLSGFVSLVSEGFFSLVGSSHPQNWRALVKPAPRQVSGYIPWIPGDLRPPGTRQ